VIIEPSEAAVSGGAIRQVFHVPTRNVSKAGLGFVVPPVFMPRLLSDESPLVRSEALFRVGANVKVRLAPSSGSMPTLRGVVIRLRPVHFGFFDVGVRFLGRCSEDGSQESGVRSQGSGVS
jgi:hypothetical protein